MQYCDSACCTVSVDVQIAMSSSNHNADPCQLPMKLPWTGCLPNTLDGMVAVSISSWAFKRGWGMRSGLEGGLKRLGELCRWEAVRAIRRDAESVARRARL